MYLESLGADPRVFALFESHAARGLILARVAVSQHHQYRLLAESGELEATPSGSLWHHAADSAQMPVSGDWVAARTINESHAIVEAVLPRKTLISRRAAGKRADEQAIAANVDLVLLVCGLDHDFNLRRLERYLALVSESGADAIVVLNKSDLCIDLPSRLDETAAVARRHPVVATNTTTEEGLRGLLPFLTGAKTIALLGSSGAGKSSIVNKLLGDNRFAVGEVREHDSRGRHTTTRRELMPLPGGGAIIDSPGMRELQLWATQNSLDQTFDDIAEIVSRCKFRNCSHSGEKGCAVSIAINEGLIAGERWSSYCKLLAEVKRHEEATDYRARSQRKNRDKAIERQIRAYYRLKGSL